MVCIKRKLQSAVAVLFEVVAVFAVYGMFLYLLWGGLLDAAGAR